MNLATRIAYRWSQLTGKKFRVLREPGESFVFVECPCEPPGVAIEWVNQKAKDKGFPVEIAFYTKIGMRFSLRSHLEGLK